MYQPLVTIAIPVYNAERYLRQAIQSCINQTYRNWELLLICDGCTDSSVAIAYEMAAKDSRISVIDDGENRGLIYRLNQSICLAKGEFYARMDADDIMFVTRLEEQISYFDKYVDVDVVGTSIMTIYSNNNIVGSGYYEGKVNSFVHPSIMGRIDWFRNNPYADWPIRAEDTELWLRTSLSSNFYAIGKPLLFYREFGVPTFVKYYATQKTLLKIYTRYKVYGKSFMWFIKNCIFTISKVVISAFFAVLNKSDIIVSIRRRKKIPQGKCLTRDDLFVSIQE